MVDRNLIGIEYPEHRATIEEWQLLLFGAAIGSDPGASVVPPTFGAVLKSAVPDPLARFRALGIDPSRVLHGDQAFVYHQPLLAGETYTVRTRIADVFARKGGGLIFIVEETTIHRADDTIVLTMRSTIIVRAS